jgi:hypothetical protein
MAASNMRRRRTAAVAIGLAVTACGLVSGCNWLVPLTLMQEHKRKIPPEFNRLESKRALVLVWAEPETLFDYPRVRLDLASYVSDKIATEVKDVTMISPRKVEDYIQRTLTADAEPRRIGSEFDAEVVIYIELLQFQIRDPQVPDLVQARIGASVVVYDLTADVDEPRQFELTPVRVTVPEGRGILMTRANVIQVRREAYVQFAEVVARKFYTWEEIIE